MLTSPRQTRDSSPRHYFVTTMRRRRSLENHNSRIGTLLGLALLILLVGIVSVEVFLTKALSEDPLAFAFAESHSLTKTLSSTPLRLPTPIFVLNLPKSGTKTIHRFFQCGLQRKRASVHHWLPKADDKTMQERVATCMLRNFHANELLIRGCGDYQVYTDSGGVWFDKLSARKRCFYPALHALDRIVRDYPSATIIHIKRNTDAWVKSVTGWGHLLDKAAGSCSGFPVPNDLTNHTITHSQWADFYDGLAESIQDFAHTHPSLTFFQGELEDPMISILLANASGLPASCWGHVHRTSDLFASHPNSSFFSRQIVVVGQTPKSPMKPVRR